MSKFQIYQGNDIGEQRWRWRLLDNNGKNIGRSEEAFVKGSIVPSIKRLKSEVDKAPVAHDESIKDEDKGYRFEYFKSEKDNQWYWRLKAGNHEIMAISGEGFPDEDEAKKQIEHFRGTAVSSLITWENPKDDPAYQEKHDDRTTPTGIPGS